MNPSSVLAIGLGAALGAILRWLLGLAFNPLLPSLPLGTLAANLLGGLLIGVLMGVFEHDHAIPLAWRLGLTTGFLGGLTTFSTFSAEAVLSLQREQFGWASLLVLAHVAGSLLATMAGLMLARMFLRT